MFSYHVNEDSIWIILSDLLWLWLYYTIISEKAPHSVYLCGRGGGGICIRHYTITRSLARIAKCLTLQWGLQMLEVRHIEASGKAICLLSYLDTLSLIQCVSTMPSVTWCECAFWLVPPRLAQDCVGCACGWVTSDLVYSDRSMQHAHTHTQKKTRGLGTNLVLVGQRL